MQTPVPGTLQDILLGSALRGFVLVCDKQNSGPGDLLSTVQSKATRQFRTASMVSRLASSPRTASVVHRL